MLPVARTQPSETDASCCSWSCATQGTYLWPVGQVPPGAPEDPAPLCLLLMSPDFNLQKQHLPNWPMLNPHSSQGGCHSSDCPSFPPSSWHTEAEGSLLFFCLKAFDGVRPGVLPAVQFKKLGRRRGTERNGDNSLSLSSMETAYASGRSTLSELLDQKQI